VTSLGFRSAKLQITELEREDEAAWDAYVYDFPTSTFYHLNFSKV